MKTENLTELSDRELLHKKSKLKINKIIDASIVGFTFGIAIYSAVKNELDGTTVCQKPAFSSKQ